MLKQPQSSVGRPSASFTQWQNLLKRHSCEIKNQIIKLRIIFVIHDLVIQLFRIKKILWSYDFDFADSYDLMICMTGFFVIQYKKARDPMIPTWKKLVILWSRNEHYSWSRDLKKKKICDLVISKFGKLVIPWSQNAATSWSCDPIIFEIVTYVILAISRIVEQFLQL